MYRATDACGNYVEQTQTITQIDTTNPVIGTFPADAAIQCASQLPAADIGLVTATDNCGGTVTITHQGTTDNAGAGCTASPRVYSRVYRATDACGNYVEQTQTFTQIDTTAPVVTPPANATVECDGAGNTTELNAWKAGASASDNCSGALTPTYVEISNVAGCGGERVITAKWTATDACGNAGESATRTFTIDDTTDPTFGGFPADRTQNADAGVCTAVLSPAIVPPSGSDVCSGATVTYERSDDPNAALSDPFPAGTTTITWTVTDACGNDDVDTQTVTVYAYNTFAIDVEIQGGLAGPVSRCLRFTFRDCPSGSPVTIDKVVSFAATGLSVAGQYIDGHTASDGLPCGVYDCVTAEDELHTLMVRVTPALAGTLWTASFTGADLLTQGDTYDDEFVDIVDFGVFIAQWGANYGSGNTSCPISPPNADMDGNGAVDVADYGFITTNFLAVGDSSCCSAPFRLVGRESITMAEALALGLPAWLDQNADGVFDLVDVQLFFEGGGQAIEPSEGTVQDVEDDEAVGAALSE